MSDDRNQEIADLASYVRGFADANQNTTLSAAAKWLDELADNVCVGGIVGCRGGANCTSDHK